MDLDAGFLITIGGCAMFVGAVAWAEVHSRRRARQTQHRVVAPETPGSGNLQPSHLVPPEDKGT